jgi:hypothetical protein
MFEETRMSRTGLKLSSPSQATAEQWGRRQPDWFLVSHHHKRIAIVDLCRPSDVHPAQLLAAAKRKQQAYLPLPEALSFYSDQGWTIHVLPWKELSLPWSGHSFSSIRCSLEGSPKMCDPTLIPFTKRRTVTMRTEDSGSSGTRTGARLMHLRTVRTRTPLRTQMVSVRGLSR